MAGSDDDWAANSVPWNPELPVFEPSHNLLLDAGPWTVPYSDFTPPPSPFALEMRSETIEQLVGGDALRRGESERIEAGRSEENSDAVAGRDRVRVQGTLHEHTGHGLAEQAAHLHTTVDGRLDVHAGNEDMVLLAGHMKDVWDGGTAIVAAMTDDTVAGGGIRVTTPLDLWMHGLMGVEERIGTCTADAVLVELGATHYEREYGPGVHAAGLAVYNGSLYLSNRSSFRPLMRVSSGVRNLIAGGGGAGDAPEASPPPAPAAGGAGTEAASETLSAASGSSRTVEAGVEAGAHTDDLTGAHRSSDAFDAVRMKDLGPEDPTQVALLDDIMASLGRALDELGGQAGAGPPSGASSDLRHAQEGVELTEAHVGIIDAFRQDIDARVAAELGDTSLLARSEDLSGPTRSADTAEQLAALKRGDMNTSSLESMGSPISSGIDDVDGSGDVSRAGPPVSERDWIPTESPGIPSWEAIFDAMTDDLTYHQFKDNQHAVNVHLAAVDAITEKTLTMFHQLGGNTDELNSIRSRMHRAVVAHRILEQMADQARQAGDVRRVDEIVQALKEIDHHAYQTAVRLSDPASALGGQASSDVGDLRYAGEIPDASTSVPGGDETPLDPARFDGYESVASMEIPEPLEIPPDRGFVENSRVVWKKYYEYRTESAWFPLIEYTRAVNSIDSRVGGAYRGFVDPAADLSNFAGHEGVVELYKRLGELATQADGADDAQRAAEIREALAAIDQVTYKLFTDLAARANDFDGTSVWMAQYRRLDPSIDGMKLSTWIQEQIEALTLRHGLELDDADRSGDALEARLEAVVEQSHKAFYLHDMKKEVIRGRDPTFQSKFVIAYMSEFGNGDQADVAVKLHKRLIMAMVDPAMQRTGAAAVSVLSGLASLPLYNRSGNFLHVPGFIHATGPNADRVDDVHGAVHAAGVAGSVPEIPRPAAAGSLSPSQGTPPPGGIPMTLTESEFELAFGSTVAGLGSTVFKPEIPRPASAGSLSPSQGTPPRGGIPMTESEFEFGFGSTVAGLGSTVSEPEIPRPASAGSLSPSQGTPPRGGIPMTESEFEFGFGSSVYGFGSTVSEGSYSRASPTHSPGGAAFFWPVLEDVFRLTDDHVDRRPGLQRDRIVQRLMNGEPLSGQDVALLRDRFQVASSSRRFRRRRQQAQAMMELLRNLAFYADSPGYPKDLSARLSIDNWQALEHLLSLLDTPRRRS